MAAIPLSITEDAIQNIIESKENEIMNLNLLNTSRNLKESETNNSFLCIDISPDEENEKIKTLNEEIDYLKTCINNPSEISKKT